MRMEEIKECKNRISALQEAINKVMESDGQSVNEELLRMSRELDEAINQWNRITVLCPVSLYKIA